MRRDLAEYDRANWTWLAGPMVRIEPELTCTACASCGEGGSSVVTGTEYSFTIIFDPDDEDRGYTVTLPALPGCVTQGDSLEEAIAMAKDAIQLYVESRVGDGQPVPTERERPQAITIKVAA